ncbi:hypothetical protein SDC9_156182 [bioreactor metagenome]|uniref:Uncharacterized protein n=1 Tax=bioreactor metagenome TaxID=1076179 RepID=A0A645F8G6_9ZZZZ
MGALGLGGEDGLEQHPQGQHHQGDPDEEGVRPGPGGVGALQRHHQSGDQRQQDEQHRVVGAARRHAEAERPGPPRRRVQVPGWRGSWAPAGRPMVTGRCPDGCWWWLGWRVSRPLGS